MGMASQLRVARWAAAAALLLSLGCDTDSVTRASDDILSVGATSTELVYHNQSPWPLSVFSLERGALAYTDIYACTDATRCESIPPGGQRRELLANVGGYAPGREVTVTYHELVPDAAGGQARARSGFITVRP